jgi:hypothetical protein
VSSILNSWVPDLEQAQSMSLQALNQAKGPCARHRGRGSAARGGERDLGAAALDEVLPRLSPETEALIDELLPSWRSPAA